MSMLHSSFKKEMRVVGIWRKVFLLSGAEERGEKLCPLLWEVRENLSVRCKDRTGNLNREYLYQNEKELGIILK